MLKTVVNRIFFGIAIGCVAFVAALFAAAIINGEVTPFIGKGTLAELLKTGGAMILVSTGFSVPALIYEKKDMALGLQVLVHMLTGTVVFCLSAYFAEWIQPGGVIGYISLAVLFGAIAWGITFLFMKRMAEKMNQKIKEKRQND